MSSMAKGNIFRVGGNKLVLQFFTFVASQISESPGVEDIRLGIDVRVVMHGMHSGRDKLALGNEGTIGEGEVLECETGHGD